MRILVVEDNPGDARLIQVALREAADKFTIDFAERLGLGLEFLLSQDVDVVLLDLNLPDSRGLDTLTKVQAHFPHLPIVIMTGIADEELAVQAVSLGAQDYLVKGQGDGELLRRALAYAIERKKTEEALKESEERFRRIVETAEEGIWTVDAAGNTTFVNNKMARMLGYTSDEMLGKPVSHFVAEEDRSRIGLATGEQQELRLRCKDGSDIWAIVADSAIVGAAGQNAGTLRMVTDISERKRAEESVIQMNEKLESRARVLEALNKELEAFSYSVSHDIRAPLRAINGFSQVLAEECSDKLDAKGKDYLRRVRGASLRMAELIDALLMLYRITRGELLRRPVDLSGMARSVGAELRAEQPERQVDFVAAPGLATEGDPHLLRVVLENLLRNAWKFTGKHDSAKIEFGADRRNGETVYFVRDDGAGFDPEYADKLFGVFQRLHAESDFPGTGIGLTTVQRIIHRHGGRVWAEGAPEQGATFYFTLG